MSRKPAKVAKLAKPAAKAPWGAANSRRGIAHIALAEQFQSAFPVGSKPTAEQFDEWAEEKELLERPTGGKKSQAWSRHLERRHQLRMKINRSAEHPRMREHGCEPYVIDWVGGNFVVNTPDQSDALHKMMAMLLKRVKFKEHQLKLLLQAKDWDTMTDKDRIFLTVIWDTVTDAGDVMRMQITQAVKRIERVATKLGVDNPLLLQ
jgi:hypothetical protein